QTGEPLPGANVLILGTTMGAASDPEGYYFIINVPVGEWTVRATMMGYEPLTVENARVSAGLTTTLNFELRPTVIEVEGVTVFAERPLIIPDATSTMHITTAEDVARQPVQTYQAVVQQQAGVVQTGGGVSGVVDGIHIRGGRGDEVAF
ncbi:MAG: TonB-dependent receptor, partial [bacterium (Candidatus Stahlbacteria) CG23_combo_of_CG06-09_8_20_14_all_40_9]